jgi:hypothetical protein
MATGTGAPGRVAQYLRGHAAAGVPGGVGGLLLADACDPLCLEGLK